MGLSSAKKVMFPLLSVWLIYLCAGLCKHYWMDYNETMWEDGEWATEDLIKFWYGSRKREDRGLF